MTARKSNQIVVMKSAVEYIRRLEDAVKRLQEESDAFRAFFTTKGLPLPAGIPSQRIVVDYEALSMMDESDSDNDDRDRRDDEVRSLPVTLPSPSSSAPLPPSLSSFVFDFFSYNYTRIRPQR
jgi:hypothetical protein